MLNKIIAVLAAITISVVGVPSSELINEETSEISIYVNGEKIEFDQAPVIKNDRLLVPLRDIFEALNATVI
ncbi:MAG: stalk domain-containing protein [Firmicutes bacterium]|nr:stalk domain-containing protein [Bacillota bacterium]